jgi:hypothetical protein
MSNIRDSFDHLERELTSEPIAGPAAGALGLHLALGLLLLSYAWMLGLFHHNFWGSPGAGGSIQVNLTSALPLPTKELNDNVLATETPSKAPAAPSPKEQRRFRLLARKRSLRNSIRQRRNSTNPRRRTRRNTARGRVR